MQTSGIFFQELLSGKGFSLCFLKINIAESVKLGLTPSVCVIE